LKRLAFTVGVALLLIAAVVCTRQWGTRDGKAIRFDLAEDCEVSLGIRDRSGALIRQLEISEPMKRGRHVVSWDGKDFKGEPVEPGSYRWIGFTHQPFDAPTRGWAGLSGTPEWPQSLDNKWGGIGGTPSAVATDQHRVYLGWTGGTVVSWRLDGRGWWSRALADDRQVQAIAVDGSTGYVLSRNARGEDALVKFDDDDGSMRWPGLESDRRSDEGLRILDLWPADAVTRPAKADALAVCAGRIYLTFTDSQFIAVLDAETGAYLQTIVGGSPECIAVTPTKAEVEEGGALVPADFAILSLRGGGLARVLLAHDPLWVVTSTIEPLDSGEHITALSIIGDGAPLHPHSLFVGVDRPFSQVQRRPILSSEGYAWSAGLPGARPDRGPWEARSLGPVRAVALDAKGRLWVAEGDAVPPRFSVWSTDGTAGRLEQEYFGPLAPEDGGAAVLASDPAIVVGGGCEWRIEAHDGPAKCLGVITREGMAAAEFLSGPAGETLLKVRHRSGETSVFERRGEGDYVLREKRPAGHELSRGEVKKVTIKPAGVEVMVLDLEHTWIVQTPDGFTIGSVFGPPSGLYIGPPGRRAAPTTSLVHAADGRDYAAVGHHAVIRFEITGLSSIRPLHGGTLAVPAAK
jgi:hypothetical protein